MTAFLDTCSRFHQYSPSNIWLIILAKPEASQVAGFRQWNRFNRYVRRGEKGIPILAPCLVKENKDDPDSPKVLKGFRVVYVFDISQTDGEDLPEPPEWKSPERNDELHRLLSGFAEMKGITITEKVLSGSTQGISKGGAIDIAPSAGTKTLVHEIAHELMHQISDTPLKKTIVELEAESVAYVVCRHFGFEDLASPNYVALHGATSDLILASLGRIQSIAAEMIEYLETIEA
jgi:hypothetical protein